MLLFKYTRVGLFLRSQVKPQVLFSANHLKATTGPKWYKAQTYFNQRPLTVQINNQGPFIFFFFTSK